MFVVFDLDGTLALSEHRAHHLAKQPKDWDAWHAECGDDEPCEPLLDTLMALRRAGHEVEIWTGRSDRTLATTVAWLNRHSCVADLRMRRDGDYRADTELKAEMMALRGKPDLVFEDRKRMVEFWRSQGVVCCQVAPGEF